MGMIFFHIGWMLNYKGQTKADKLYGNFGYIKESGTGDEQFNFLPHKGYLYGYVPIVWDEDTDQHKAIRFEKHGLGGTETDDFLQGIDVIFFAKNPDDDITYIVGWYRDATLYRYPQELPGRMVDGHQFYYSCKTLAKNGVCVPVSKRIFEVPSAHKKKGGFGMSAVWYADKLPNFKDKVLAYIDNYDSPERHPRFNPDQDVKLTVEKNSVQAVWDYYENLGYSVKSVEKDNLGWDLMAVRDNGTELFIEVKGLSGQNISIQLTPNEYANLKEHHKKYILAICTNSLIKPRLHIFTIIKDRDKDIYSACDDEGNILQFEESISAFGRIKE